MADETTAVNLLLLKMKEHLTTFLQTNIDAEDITRADIVKLGLLFDNKSRKNIQIGVNSGDHDLPEELDGIVTLEKLPKIGMEYPPREIGGGQIWMRRGVVKIECFFIRERLTEEQAFEKANTVMGRLTNSIGTVPIYQIPRDDFGERVISIHCYASSFFESGGPPSSYIFRGKALWAAFTDRL